MKRLVAIVIAVVVLTLIYTRYHDVGGQQCQVLGAGVAHADMTEDCLHQNARSATWANAQQTMMMMNDAPETTGMLFTDPNGTDSTMIRSGKLGPGYALALGHLTGPGRQQAAEHVEPQAAALMRDAGTKFGVLVINNDDGLCSYVMRVGCQVVVGRILPSGSTMVVWAPQGDPISITGSA